MTTTTAISTFERAVEAGRHLDLEGCAYDSRPGVDGRPLPTPAYYRFLAGLVRTERLTAIVEIGTFHGGATLAMAAGVPEDLRERLTLCTVDVVRLNEGGLTRPGIHRFLGDALRHDVVRDVTSRFDRHIDLLFVDAGHDFRQTWEDVAVYANRLKPRFVVVDDIRLNRSMRRMWDALTAVPCANAVDVSELVDRSRAGFGVLEPSYPCHFDEMSAARRAAWMAYWTCGRTITRRLPHRTAERIRLAMRGGH